MAGDYRIASTDRAGLARMLDWAAAEGWNPGLADGDNFHAADPDGFWLGTLDGEPIGGISAVRAGDDFGFIGLYIVTPGMRGRGHGLALWQAAMESLRGRCIGLDGVPAQQDNYRRSGFVLAHRNVRYAGLAPAAVGLGEEHPEFVDLAEVDPAELAAFDRQHFPAPRRDFLAAWLHNAERAIGWREGGRLRGMGVVRACRDGFKVGPLYADTPAIAAALFDSLCARLPAIAPVFLDLPVPNQAAQALAEARGMKPVFETARMYANGLPELPLQRIFGITSFELG